MKTVNVRITKEDYIIEVLTDNDVLREKWEKTPLGSTQVEGNFEKEPAISEQLYYELSSLSSSCYDIMKNLD